MKSPLPSPGYTNSPPTLFDSLAPSPPSVHRSHGHFKEFLDILRIP